MKKLLSLVLVCVLALGCAAAFAEEGADSKGGFIPAAPTAKGADVKTLDDLDEDELAEVTENYTNVVTALLECDGDLEKVFDTEATKDLTNILGLKDGETASIDTVQPVILEWDGKSPVQLSFNDLGDDVHYEKGQAVVVMVGIPGKDGEIEWVAVEAEVNEKGGVDVELDEEIMEKISAAGGKTTMAFASKEKEEDKE